MSDSLSGTFSSGLFGKSGWDIQATLRLFQECCNRSPAPMILTDLDSGTLHFCNKAGEALFELNPDSLSTTCFQQLPIIRDSLLQQASWESFIRQPGNGFREEISIKTGDQPTRWFIVSAQSAGFENQPRLTILFVEEITQTKTSLEAIDERNLLRTLIDNIPDSIYVKDQEGRKLITNQIDLNYMQRDSAESVLGKTDLEIFGEAQGRKPFEDDMAIIHSGEALINKEESFTDRNGQSVCLLTSKVPIFNDQHEVVGLMGIGRDISRFKLVEDLLRKSNDRFEHVTRATFDAIWEWDMEGDYVYRSEVFYTLFGYDFEKDRIDWKEWYSFIHPDDQKIVADNFERFLATDLLIWSDQYRFRKADGSYAMVQNKCIKIHNAEGKLIRLAGALQDITSQKKEEEQLRLMESAVERSTEAIIITEAGKTGPDQPKIVYINEALSQLTGYTREEMIGRTPRMFQGPGTDRFQLKKIREARAKWQPCEAELLNYNKQGEEYWIHLSISPIKDRAGNYTHWISVERDITAKKRAEQERQVFYEIIDGINRFGLEQSLQLALEKIGRYLQLGYGEAWMLNYDKLRMTCKCRWQVSERTNLFFDREKDGTILKGHSLKGKAWERKSILCWNNLQEESFSRKEQALKCGLKSAVAIPVLYNGEVIAIFSFFSEYPLTEQQIRNDLLQRISTQLGAGIDKKRTEEELNNFFMLSADMLCVAGMDGQFKKVNPAFSTVLGYSEEELLSKPFFHFVHPDDFAETTTKIQSLASGEPLWFFENRFITKSGEFRWLEWTGTPVPEDNLLFAIAKDITQKKKLEQERKQLLESISDNFYALDRQFRFTYLNKSANELLSDETHSLLMKNIWETFPVLKNSEFYTHALDAVEKQEAQHFEYYSPVFECWFEQNFYPTEDGLSVFFRSIQERKLAETRMHETNAELERKAGELERINTELERFAYVASHDLQEPLSMFNGFLQLLQKKYSDQLDADGQQYIHFATDGASRMKVLIHDLLQYSRAGGQINEQETVPLEAVVSDVTLLLRAAIAEKKAVIQCGQLPVIHASRTAMQQLFQNLIGNSLKYQNPETPPQIEITAEQKDQQWIICVADNGMGIPEEYREEIFEVFQRLHSRQKFSGTGIGLSICKKIIEKLHGKIWMEPNHPAGSRFLFSLPITQ